MNKTNGVSDGRTILATKFLNENSILVESSSSKEDYPSISVRYFSEGEVKEDKIAIMTEDTFIEYNEFMVAVFKRSGRVIKKAKLIDLYDVRNHEFGNDELLNLDYYSLVRESRKARQLNRRNK